MITTCFTLHVGRAYEHSRHPTAGPDPVAGAAADHLGGTGQLGCTLY